MATAAISNAVKVTEECKVIPAPNPLSSDDGNNYLPMSVFDTVWIKFPLIQQIYFYKIHHLSPEHFYNTILPKLKHSLSLTLQHYPSLAGTLTWHPVDTDKPIIRYCTDDGDGDGVPFSVAESCTLDFDSVSGDHFKEAKDLHHLLPDFHVSESVVKVLSLRVTLFPNHGFSICSSCHHSSMDGKSASMFFNSWATICRVGALLLTPELIPILDRSLIHDPNDICTIFTDKWMKIIQGTEKNFVPMDIKSAPGLFRSTFRLTPEQVGQIKEKLSIITKSRVSTFTAVCSYVWTCLVKTEDEDEDEDEEFVYLNVVVDCRGGGRGGLEPPVPANYFGNCITYRHAKAKVESLKGGDHGLAVAAAAIKEAIESLDHVRIDKEVEKWLLDLGSIPEENEKKKKIYGISGSPRFDFYGVDFGWGRAEKVEMVNIDRDVGSFSLCGGCRDGSGVIEIGIVFTKPKMEAFASIFAQGLLQEIASNY